MKSTIDASAIAKDMIQRKNLHDQLAVIPHTILCDLYANQPISIKIKIMEETVSSLQISIDWFDAASEDDGFLCEANMIRLRPLVSKLHRATLQLANLRAEALQSEQ